MERKQAILAYLKEHGEAPLDAVATHLALTKQGALRHLDGLRTEGLVEMKSEERHDRPGRPRHVFRLTPAAAERFPHTHRELAADLVRFLDRDQLERFFNERAARVEAEFAQRMRGRTLSERADELARLATEKGHMASVTRRADGSLAIQQCNCPIVDVAASTGHPCRQEMEMYSRLLGAAVERVSFLPESGTSCTYVVITEKTGRNRKRPSAAATRGIQN